MGIVNRGDLRRTMIDKCILLTEEEYSHLEAQYIKGGFFNYIDMLSDLDRLQPDEKVPLHFITRVITVKDSFSVFHCSSIMVVSLGWNTAPMGTLS